ncbi:type II and III secretion system protein family protein [Caulobacter sp. NIBR1757]|uniref:type II and III secretion system protein family protein n=1 Tax=Caulobacter sp. NIBR1757 TaxID=3016000 RepID=UPI0022F11BF9|nr:type II and III secretion system protein family protein [Caulobacter sp. NIBR1757]WGM40952.1 Type 3 secretion system secretin [Caulobacter sp. NIBR1757]
MRALFLTAGACLAFASAPAFAQTPPKAAPVATPSLSSAVLPDVDFPTFTADAAPSRSIIVAKDKSTAFRLSGSAGQIVVAQPDIAEIVANTDRSLYIRGKTLGATNILVYDNNKRLVEVIDVKVGHDLTGIQADMTAALPGEPIKVSNLAGGLMLTGQVSTSSVAARAKTIAERYAPGGVSSTLTVEAAQQVMLEVRILEASRDSLKDFGINLAIANNSGVVFGSGLGLIGNNPAQGTLGISTNVGPTTIDVTLRALEEKGVIRTLARPNLAAISGEEATFLAGGEFPYPVPAGVGEVTIEFKPFGVNLKFTPTVQDSGLIRLKVAPEVSALDPTNALKIGAYELPALTVRRASTTIELRDGESFAIAGMFQQDYVNAVRQLPWVGDIPVLGTLFKSGRWKRSETELLILVTPRLTTAAQSQSLTPNPMIAGSEPTAIDVIFAGMVMDKPMTTPVGATPSELPTPY